MLMRTIDLCAGIGGIRRGFEMTGNFKNVASAEIDELACRTYQHLFGDNPRNDVASDDFKQRLQKLHYDVLLAGFPCQTFSSVGLKQGFEDTTKGTIFFDIAKIVKMTRPKVIFLENVQHLLVHDNRSTFATIIDTLDNELNYHIVGISYDKEGIPRYKNSSFIRNSRDFGIPQNRPRVYIIAFSRVYYGQHLSLLPNEMPSKRRKGNIYNNLNDLLEKEVDAKYFLSSGYLETLERHIEKQHLKGNGFGYKVVNHPDIKEPVANTILAVGGSGRERNLIYDPKNGESYAGQTLQRKLSPINNKSIRTMTPTEWGRLQGFIGYAFVDDQGIDRFSFPDGIATGQQFKQFGNSVTIPVIEELASFVSDNLVLMEREFSSIEKRLYSMYGNEFLLCHKIWNDLRHTLREKTLNKYFDVAYHFGLNSFKIKDLSQYLKLTTVRTYQIIRQLTKINCLKKEPEGMYRFTDYLSMRE
ncbi:C-5 cytosine-specific DNA methylase [anaerobic digester metagenome]